MKFISTLSTLAISLVIYSSFAQAGSCVIHVKREACSEASKAESFAKCKGKPSANADASECDEDPQDAKNDKDCAKKALKACDNARLTITKSKVITAKFDGAPVMDGKNFCDNDRPDFNKCGK